MVKIKKLSAKLLSQFAMLFALYVVILYICISFSREILAFGGAITFTFLITTIAIYRINWAAGSIISFFGTIIANLISGTFIFLNFWQFILDWFAFPIFVIPILWLIFKNLEINKKNILLFQGIALFFGYFFAVLSGYLFWSQDAPIYQTAIEYSLLYNAIAFIPSIIITLSITYITWDIINFLISNGKYKEDKIYY